MTVTKTIALPSGRTLVGYDLCSGRAISDGSTAQMMNFVEDAKKDIAYLASLSSRSAEAGKPEVKALEWARNGNRHDAGSIVGRYTIEGRNPGYGLLVPAPVAVRLFIDLEAAKAAAQSDYESRILSALAAPVADSEPVSSPTYAEITEPYRAALRMIREAIETIFGPTANLESEEAELLRGPEPHHTAEAVISALQNIAAKIEPVSVPDGVELAARFVEKRLNDYVQEHGAYDNSTGATEFPGNGDEYVYELEEIIEGIRALATASHSSKTEEVGPVVTDEMVNRFAEVYYGGGVPHLMTDIRRALFHAISTTKPEAVDADAVIERVARTLIKARFGDEGLMIFDPVPDDFEKATEAKVAFAKRADEARSEARAVVAALKSGRSQP